MAEAVTHGNFEPLLVREEGSTLIVTIQRPEALNALNQPVLRALNSLLDWLQDPARANLRVMIITGSGEKAFVAGADIKEFESLDPKAASEFAFRGQKLFARLGAIGIPVIAAVNGFALGGGLELALACDFIYASENAKFGLPECTLGLLPGYGGTVRLPRRVGPARARELMYTGSMVGADEALRIGLVNRVVPQAELLKVAQETAQTIASRAPIAIAKIKDCVQNGAQITEERASELEARHFGELFSTADQKEGVRAFIEKRKAQFQGR